MKKKHCLLILLLIFIPKANAQFVGYYNMHDGGIDMPNSSLFVLPNNEFKYFYYNGYITGNWRTIDKTNIVLTELKTKKSPFILYGSEGENKKTRLNVNGLSKSNAFVSFSKDTITTKEFQPVFNIGANCFAEDYTIEKKNGEYNWISLSIATIPEIGRSLATKYPYKAMSYTFPLDKKHQLYTVLFDEDALRENFEMILTKKNNLYSINERNKLQREDLTDEILKAIELNEKSIDKENSFSRYGSPVNVSSSSEIIIYKPIIKPIFTSKCKNDINESETENDQKVEKQKLISVERINGFYTVVNLEKNNKYNTKKYQLAQEPSIIKADVLSVKKVVSDYGGYEIEFIFTEKGSVKFAEFSKKNIENPIAIVINKSIVSTPILLSEITGGKANIYGRFSESEIDDLIMHFNK